MPKNLKLKAARAEKDLTQSALAEAAGVSRQTINAIKKASTTPPSTFAAASARSWAKHWTNYSGRNKR